jgi:hypothetical protein
MASSMELLYRIARDAVREQERRVDLIQDSVSPVAAVAAVVGVLIKPALYGKHHHLASWRSQTADTSED